jgi:Fe-S cluster assembly ATP-binding protein
MLELKDVSFAAELHKPGDGTQRREIIRGMNFTFEAGRFYTITGPNGSGKTTLANLIMGINQVTSGSIIFEGADITGMSITERAKAGIAFSLQSPARFKGITFRDLLSIASGTEEEAALIGIIQRVGICSLSFLDRPVDSKLSGGEIKKIEMATIIARNPKLAMYDEPDTGIDLWTIEPMVELLKSEQKLHRTTTIVISHNRAFLEAADVIVIIKEGGVIYQGDMEAALPLLNDLSICGYRTCGDETYNECFR